MSLFINPELQPDIAKIKISVTPKYALSFMPLGNHFNPYSIKHGLL